MLFRHCDRRWPFLWESADQPAGRWNRCGGGPTQYLADTPDGAWAEFCRHEGITDQEDLAGISRALRAVEVDEHELRLGAPALPADTLTGGPDTYPACQTEAARLRDDGARGLRAPAAALTSDGARGYRIDVGFRDGPEPAGETVVLFGRRPDVVGWQVVSAGRPPVDLLARVRPLIDAGGTGPRTGGSSHG